MRLGLFSILALILVLPISASAQFEGLGGSSGAAFSLSVSPQYPAPYSQTIVSTLSDTLDLSNATLTASVAGKEVYKGAVRPFPVILGKTGSVTTVRVTIVSAGNSYSQTLSIVPQEVILILEPVSSAPPLYPGKPSIPLEGDVRVIAVANLRSTNGAASNPASYAYAWTVDGTQIANASGIGKSSLLVATPMQYRVREVSVAVMSSDGTLVGGATASLSGTEPYVRIYENDPLLGIRYGHVLSNSFAINGAESTLYAAPFSFPTTGGAPLIEWFLNGDSAQTGNSITLRPSGSGQGSASLSLTASAGSIANAFASFSISFGAKSGGNFFGL